MKHSYKEIAENWNLWTEYVDTDGTDTEEWFNATSVKEKTEQITSCFGQE